MEQERALEKRLDQTESLKKLLLLEQDTLDQYIEFLTKEYLNDDFFERARKNEEYEPEAIRLFEDFVKYKGNDEKRIKDIADDEEYINKMCNGLKTSPIIENIIEALDLFEFYHFVFEKSHTLEKANITNYSYSVPADIFTKFDISVSEKQGPDIVTSVDISPLDTDSKKELIEYVVAHYERRNGIWLSDLSQNKIYIAWESIFEAYNENPVPLIRTRCPFVAPINLFAPLRRAEPLSDMLGVDFNIEEDDKFKERFKIYSKFYEKYKKNPTNYYSIFSDFCKAIDRMENPTIPRKLYNVCYSGFRKIFSRRDK